METTIDRTGYDRNLPSISVENTLSELFRACEEDRYAPVDFDVIMNEPGGQAARILFADGGFIFLGADRFGLMGIRRGLPLSLHTFITSSFRLRYALHMQASVATFILQSCVLFYLNCFITALCLAIALRKP